jgi:uncharacterized BrkB/YihY/UPF0761 family membrane protein
MKKLFKICLAVSLILVMALSVVSAFDIDTNPSAIGGASEKAATILGYIQWGGFIIAVGILVAFGIKYVMATANEKADLKSGFVKYLIGAVLIAAGPTIATWIFSAAQ